MPASPKPLALRVVSGGGRDRVAHRKVNTEQPKPRLGVEAPAKQLDKRARAEYDKLVEEMRISHPKLLTRLDSEVLAIFCQAWILWLDMTEKIDADKAAGRPVDRFDVVMWTKFAQQMHMSGDRLGFSPVARMKLSMPENGPVDDDDF